MEELLPDVKEFLRIYGDHDDKMLGLLINSAKEYMLNAGVEEQNSDLYKLAIAMLVTHWYENREQVTGSLPHAVSLGLQSMILQLRVGVSDESK